MNLTKKVVGIVSFLAVARTASASVFLGGSNDGNSKGTFGGMSSMTSKPQTSCRVTNMYHQKMSKDENQRQLIARTIRRQINPTANGAAMAIPGTFCFLRLYDVICVTIYIYIQKKIESYVFRSLSLSLSPQFLTLIFCFPSKMNVCTVTFPSIIIHIIMNHTRN